MDAEPRPEEQIRSEIVAEQEQLADAVAALRRDLDERRSPARHALVALVGVMAVVVVARIVRRVRCRPG